jgi:hypothetical protein
MMLGHDASSLTFAGSQSNHRNDPHNSSTIQDIKFADLQELSSIGKFTPSQENYDYPPPPKSINLNHNHNRISIQSQLNVINESTLGEAYLLNETNNTTSRNVKEQGYAKTTGLQKSSMIINRLHRLSQDETMADTNTTKSIAPPKLPIKVINSTTNSELNQQDYPVSRLKH